MSWAHKHLSIKQTQDFSRRTSSRVNPFTYLWWKATSLGCGWEHIVLDCLEKRKNIAFRLQSWITYARNVNNKEQIEALMVNRVSKGDERDWTNMHGDQLLATLKRIVMMWWEMPYCILTCSMLLHTATMCMHCMDQGTIVRGRLSEHRGLSVATKIYCYEQIIHETSRA